jgi:transcription elongation factor Elf1
MGKCVNCGNRKLIQDRFQCIVCGREGCSKCLGFLFEIVENGYPLEKIYACSDKCLDDVAKDVESQMSLKDMPADSWNQIPPIHFLTERAILNLNNSKRLQPNVTDRIRKGKELHVYFSPQSFVPKDFLDAIGKREDKVTIQSNPLWNKLFRHASTLKAQLFETLREYENAAKVYKSLGMYEEAGRVRDKRNEIRVKKTDISVNLTNLLEQVRNGGIVAVFRCPHCGGKLKIGKDTKPDSLRTCEHCGSEIETMDLTDFLKTVLS